MTSRIIVKNLPPNLSQPRLKAHFSAQQSGAGAFSGTVTDAKLVTDARTGRSRGFAFVGYRTQEEALKAVEWFNGTFMDMRKIAVELAKPAGDDSLGQSWREKNREYLARQKKARAEETKDEQPKKRKRNVDDDDAGKDDVIKKLTESKRKNKLLVHNPDLDTAQRTSIKPESAVAEGQEKSTKKKKKEEGTRVKVIEPVNVVEVVYDDSATQPPREDPDSVMEETTAMTDLDWVRSRTSRTFGLVSDSGESDTEDKEEEKDRLSDAENEDEGSAKPATDPSDIEEEGEEQEEAGPRISTAESKILKTGRLFLRNLVYGITEDDLHSTFSPFGELEEVHIPTGANHESLPIAFILFSDPRNAAQAFKELDGTDLQGRLMHIIPGDEKRVSQEDDLEGKTLKERREIERRKQAGRGLDWGTLFMNQDAVLSSLAARYGVTKSDLLLDNDSSTTDPAIKSAMAETTILTETKSYLVEHGVNLASLTSSAKQRSETVVIAKNFPYGTTQDELLHLFGGTEIIKRILLPPAGTIAFLEFFDAGEARAAFKRLAYRRFKDVPLYLEKAPHGIFVVEPAQRLVGVQAKMASSDLLAAEDDEPGSTLYLKNLDFSTTQAGLTDAFQHFSGFRVASLKTKTNAKGDRLSMGFGFVTFASKVSAQGVMNAGVVLDGRKLELKFARQGSEAEIKAGKGSGGAGRKKIVVKNLGFNVNKRDLRELFGTYGHIQSLRLPKKFDNSTRGFAFIEFTTTSDARNAMQALEHTHLLGRHLVLQWAEEEDGTGVEKVRGKIREGVEAGAVGEMMGFNQGAGGRVGDVFGEEEM